MRLKLVSRGDDAQGALSVVAGDDLFHPGKQFFTGRLR